MRQDETKTSLNHEVEKEVKLYPSPQNLQIEKVTKSKKK